MQLALKHGIETKGIKRVLRVCQAMKMSMMEERARMEKAIEESKKDANVATVDDEDETVRASVHVCVLAAI